MAAVPAKRSATYEDVVRAPRHMIAEIVLPDEPFFSLAPDWICEVLSPSTEDFDRADKLPVYARARVAHVWLVDPAIKTLEVFRLDSESRRLVGTWKGDSRVRAEPFAEFELELAELWQR